MPSSTHPQQTPTRTSPTMNKTSQAISHLVLCKHLRFYQPPRRKQVSLINSVRCSTEPRAVSATKERSWSYDGRKEGGIGSRLTEDSDDEGCCLHVIFSCRYAITEHATILLNGLSRRRLMMIVNTEAIIRPFIPAVAPANQSTEYSSNTP